MTYRAFLSHSTKDADHISALQESLASVGVDLYVAEHDGQAGKSLAKKVTEQIARCDVTIVLLTTNGYDAAFVQQEIGGAVLRRKLVVPLVGPGVDTARLGLLQGVEYIPFDPGNPRAANESLMSRLGTLAQKRQQQENAVLVGAVIFLLVIAFSSNGK